MLERREILRGLGWLAGAAVISVPRNIFAATMPTEQLQSALGHLGYLPRGRVTGIPDEDTERALIRFKRHANRAYRVSRRSGKAEDVSLHGRFSGDVDGSITEETIFELKQWVERGWTLPIGRFKLTSLAESGKPASQALRWSLLREDAASLWRDAMKSATEQGATLAEPYGDTFRGLGFSKKDGTSRTSLHICGRAVDLNQRLGQGFGQRYYLSPEQSGDAVHFRLYCKTEKQDGSQGRRYGATEVRCWRAGLRHELFLPAGWYVDLTELLGSFGFERVRAQTGWERWDVRSEWWHYYHAILQPETFLDECELIGISERRLISAGYSRAEMDGEPG